MEQRTNINIPRHSITYFLLCLFGILVFVFIGIVPSQKSLAGFDQKIEELKYQIEEQKGLYPIYQSLHKQAKKEDSDAVSFPPRVRLAVGQIDKLVPMVTDVAGQSRLEVVSVTPDLKSLAGDSKTLLLNMTVKGEFPNLRKFLMGLVAIPYLEHIEEIQIQQTPDSMELKAKVWIALG
jgi:Tfp pilus assembly protein PilO